MNFLIASIGIFIYMYIIIKEMYTSKHNSYNYDSKYNYISNIYEDWEKYFVDIELEKKARIEISSNEYNVYKLVSPIICSLKYFPDKFDNHLEFYEFMSSFPDMILRIYMALNHKLLQKDAINGIKSPDVYSPELIDRWKMNHEIMKWVDKQIRMPNGKYEMYFVNGSNLDKVCSDTSYMLELDNIPEPIGGRYCWITNIKYTFIV